MSTKYVILLARCANRFPGILRRGYFSTIDLHNDESKHKNQPLYEGHIPISLLQRAILTVGSTIVGLTSPERGDMVAVNGESSGYFALKNMYQRMQADAEGAQILRERPRINSQTVNLEKLENYPEGTLGKEYVNFLKVNNVSPDTRAPVRFVDDAELAYVMTRYRETHDLVHTLLGMKTNILGEVTVKWIEGLQTGLPMCIGGGIFGAARLKSKNRATYLRHYLPWAIRAGTKSRFLMNVFYERRWEQSIDELRRELNIEPPPKPLK